MADRRIDQLTEAEDISDDDLFVIWKQNISQTRSLKMQSLIPVGAIMPFYGSIAPDGWFICDGTDTTETSNELRLYHPKLYKILGNSNVLPDLRECVLVGAGQSTRAILDKTGHSHDVYTVGEFKDDQFQGHGHALNGNAGGVDYGSNTNGFNGGSEYNRTIEQYPSATYPINIGYGIPRIGMTTHGKQLGVNYIIKC